MTAMIMHNPPTLAAPKPHHDFWQHSLAATLALALHAGVLALLINTWSPSAPEVKPPRVLTTQLVMVAPPVQPPAPAPEPTPAAIAEPVVAAPVEPVKPLAEPQPQAPKVEQAALARKRVEERKREQQAEQQRQQTEERKRADAATQQRLAQQQAAQQQANQAQQQAQQAERARQQALADSRQYLPLSKDAPEYPERALDKNIEGDCSVEYTVNPQGRVEHPKVLDGCHPLFIRPSLAAAQTFRYQPRIVEGVAVSVPAVRNTFHYRIK
ncbi:energy transducer TonB [Pseudomonas anatoliensis]|uniref:energy transducer TonB n=1 Tax=Pseudomonas anatoliensis TaxID=2710589 RepID=UPI001B338D2D|nr:energy transducer TonB [Pseudomonas anatoliensis]MBP5959015.1 energy transducer TonB [Pseudomonas anatoliensis]